MKFLKEMVPYIIIFIIVILVRMYLVTPVRVIGSSMYPTLHNGEVLFLNKINYRFNDIKRFDIVVVNRKEAKDDIIKRVIGLPFEHVKYENGKLYINDKEVEDKFSGITNDFDLSDLGIDIVLKDQYFVVGDNRNDSSDSRIIGLIDRKDILGKTSVRIWPLNKIGMIK